MSYGTPTVLYPLTGKQANLIQEWLDSGFYPPIGPYDAGIVKLTLQAFLVKGEYSHIDAKFLTELRREWIEQLKYENAEHSAT